MSETAADGVVFALMRCMELRMKARSVAAGFLTLFALGCGYRIKTSTDYDRAVNFSSYSTFFMVKGNSSGNALLDQRAASDVQNALTDRGWVEVPAGEGRAAVVIHAATKTKHTYQTFYDGWGGWRWRGGPGGATTFVEDYKVGTLVVDIFDATTKQAIWRGHASDALLGNPSANEKVTQAAVDRLFIHFPPASAAAQ
jgi:hypothetical protein